MQNTSDNKQPTCPVCLSPKANHFIEYQNHIAYKCGDCRSVYIFPHVSEEMTLEMYNSTIERATREFRTRFKKKMRRSRKRARRLKTYTKGNRFLDVGSNVGFMVESAREAGFIATGIELDQNYVKIATTNFPQNTFINDLIENITNTDGGYDMVYCSEVIEHIPEPRAFAKALTNQVAPGGYLYITTPDITHWRTPSDIRTWDAFCPPAHCVYFTPQSLKELFEQNGLILKKKFLAFKPGMKMLFQRQPS